MNLFQDLPPTYVDIYRTKLWGIMAALYVYILTNKPKGVLYIGVTNNIARRIYEHKEKLIEGFSKKYKLNKLVYVEEYQLPQDAIAREKQLKNWHRV